MTKEEAKELLTHVMISYVPKDQYGDFEDPEPYDQAFDMAIEALSAEPKTDGVFVKGGLTISGEPPMPEGCMDCKLQNRCLCIPPDLSADEISELYISRRPNCPLSMVAEPKTGEWIAEIGYYGEVIYYECSHCGNAFTLIDGTPEDNNYNFCPNCGADMRGDKE